MLMVIEDCRAKIMIVDHFLSIFYHIYEFINSTSEEYDNYMHIGLLDKS